MVKSKSKRKSVNLNNMMTKGSFKPNDTLIQDYIEQFCIYFLKQINAIHSGVEERLYRKILYISIIDTLSLAVYPDYRNHKRVVSFIDNYSNWPYKDKVSLVQLLFNLNCEIKEKKRSGNKLYKYVSEKISALKQGQIYRPDIDPMLDEISKLASKNEERLIYAARYTELFYTYRNVIIHEFREPGYPIEWNEDDTTPLYHSFIAEVPWQLVFPTGVFKILCKNCLEGLKTHLLIENVDPYKRYKFGNMWSNLKRRKKCPSPQNEK